MSEIEELYENFPTILKEKLRNKEIEFPSNTKFDYEKIYVYRAVSREITDFHEIDKNDFRSYFELGKKPKKLVKGRSLKMMLIGMGFLLLQIKKLQNLI